MAEFVDKMSKSITDESQRAMLGYLRKFRSDDLEAILGELDTIIDLDYAQRLEGHTTVQNSQVPFSLSRVAAKSLRTRIKHAIIREYRDVDGPKTSQLYKPLFDLLFRYVDKGQCLTTFTTNYDPAIEEFYRQEYPQYELCDGFAYDPADRHNYWSRSVFDRLQAEPEKRNIALFKLHGSVDWLFVKSSRRIRRGQAMYDAIDSDAYENILIYPATRKIATEDPFYTGYEYFERCCERARVCVAIGYSFRDYDALTRLRGAVSINEQLRLLLVDPFAETILPNVRIPDERKIPLNFKFGETPDQFAMLSGHLEEHLRKA